MPGVLTHSPAAIVQEVLIDEALGTNQADNAVWPVFRGTEPDTPDNCITVYDTQGRDEGSEQITGERQERHGIQVRVRGGTYAAGWAKAKAIAEAIDTEIYQKTITLAGVQYLVHKMTRTSDVLSLGADRPNSNRQVFVVNALVSIRQQ